MTRHRRLLAHVVAAVAVGGMALSGIAPGQKIVLDEIPNMPAAPEYVEPPVTGHGYASDRAGPTSLDAMMADLRSDDYDKREEATRGLLLLPPQRLDEIRRWLDREQDPEVAARLQQVAVHLFLKARTPLTEGEGTLLGVRSDGVSFEQMRVDPGQPNLQMTLVINEIEPGFPAAQMLFPGDRLVAIDGERFEVDMDFLDFRSKVTRHPAGSLVKFMLLRGGKMREVEVQTASLKLGKGSQQDAIDLRNEAVRRFLQTLRMGEKVLTLVMPEPMHYREVEPLQLLR